MQYQLKSVRAAGKPETKKIGLPPIEKYGINIVVTVEIIDQPYNGFCNNDAMFFELEKTDTIDQSEIKMNAFAVSYVATKYPNT